MFYHLLYEIFEYLRVIFMHVICPKQPQQNVLMSGCVVTDEQNQQTLAFSRSFIDKREFAVRHFYPIYMGDILI